MVLLLGSRGRSRGRSKSGIFSSLSRVVNTLVGRSANASSVLRRDARKPAVPWLALGMALLCFVGGYLAGSHLAAGKPGDGEAVAGLNAGGAPRTPGIIAVDARPLHSEAFVVSIYERMPMAEAKDKARELAEYLFRKGLQKARPYEFPTEKGPLWVVAVYFDGPSEMQGTRDRLRALPPDVPDAVFVSLRNSVEDWPRAYPIR